jgi:NADPH:quinone reductase-like Zn-dependent oxidoreductase
LKAVVYHAYGPPDVLGIEDVPKPVPRDNEILVEIHAATVVAGDCELRSFNFPLWIWLPLRVYTGLLRPTRARILGQELAGRVEAIGAGVERFGVGDQVFAATEIGLGCYAEYRCLRENKVVAPKPRNMSYEEAAAVPTGGLNALHYMRKANLRGGEKVLINGAAGNIGSYAVQLAKHFGAEVTGVDSAAKLDMLRSIGADHVIDYAEVDFTGTGEIYDVVFDVIGKSPFSRTMSCLKENGRYIIANPSVTHMIRGVWTSLTGNKKVIFRFASYTVDDLITLKELIEAGELRAVIDRRYPLDRIAEAHGYVDDKRHKGNVALTIDHPAPT